jgi:NADH/NAD ratio-sensing transcriptional regulator Rex
MEWSAALQRGVENGEIKSERVMRYYVYFDKYRHPSEAINEKELAEKYDNDPAKFRKAMSCAGSDATAEQAVGHVGVLNFESEKELKAYLDAGEEIAGFYECRADSRQYNF